MQLAASAAPGRVEVLLDRLSPSFLFSAVTGEGIDDLLSFLKGRVELSLRKVKITFSSGDGRRFALLNELGVVEESVYEDANVIVTARVDPADIERLKRLPGSMKVENIKPTKKKK